MTEQKERGMGFQPIHLRADSEVPAQLELEKTARFRAHTTALLSAFLALVFVVEARAIVGGSDADEGEFPWIAGIVRKDVFPGPALIGGGALVGGQWVVTAAHSVQGLAASNLEVWLGVRDIGETSTRRVFQVLSVIRHPDYSIGELGTGSSDLALLLLDRRVVGLPLLPLVEVPEDLAEGTAARVAGWGTSTPGKIAVTPRLQKAPAEIVSQAVAESFFGPVIEPVHLAARDPAQLATPCFGDSGGPLVVEIGGLDRLAGVVSFGGADCSDATIPTIYTRMPLFAEWTKARLALTAVPPRVRLAGRGRNIPTASAPRLGNGSLIPLPRLRPASVVRPFRLTNTGRGLLTLSSVGVGGARFSLARAPGRIVAAGGSTELRIRVRVPRGGRRFGGNLVIRTNEPSRPVQVYRFAARRR
jgi:hypothetical protein